MVGGDAASGALFAAGGAPARGGGARAWRFLKRNGAYREAYANRPAEMAAHEAAPFPLRRQSHVERALGRFGLHAFEDPLAEGGPVSPFWAVAPMLAVVAVRERGPGVAELARAAGTALAGLRLEGGALLLKLERGGHAQQVRLEAGAPFDPWRDGIEVRLRPGPGSAGRLARSAALLGLLGAPAPPPGRGRGRGTRSCCGRSTSSGPGSRSRRSRRRCGARGCARACGTTRTGTASGCGAASGARATWSMRAT